MQESQVMEIPAISQHEHSLRFRALRNQVLSSNIANADTPGYKARDLDFGSALKSARGESIGLTRTSDLHKQAWGTTTNGAKMMYRVPSQPTLDGNTVSMDVEQAAFAENALQYRASLAFLDGSIRTLKYAIKGSE
jgi:flagellar basal-body rod protein FlgB